MPRIGGIVDAEGEKSMGEVPNTTGSFIEQIHRDDTLVDLFGQENVFPVSDGPLGYQEPPKPFVREGRIHDDSA